MTTPSELLNEPAEIELAGKKIKLKKLGPVAVIALAERVIKDKEIATIQQALKQLGLAENERVDFALKAMQQLPSGDDLQEKAQDWINSIDGIVSCLHMSMIEAGEEITKDEVFHLVDKATEDQIAIANKQMISRDEGESNKDVDPTKDQN